ncbi:MAG: hypothetical protein JW902_12620 [Syntrophaceae bacterium]|nr:hypothetical protein [Syntrophaceae bacterium]
MRKEAVFSAVIFPDKEFIMIILGKTVAAWLCAFLISQMCGCASSRLVDVWHDSSFQAPPLNKMLVVAVRKDATTRRIWEDAFAGELAKHGLAAVSSYSLFPDAPPDTQQVITAVSANGFDGILVVLMLPTETNSHYVQGYTTTEQDKRYSSPEEYQSVRYVYQGGYPYANRNVRYISYWQRYRTYYREIEHPGYIDSQTVDIRTIDVTTTGNDGRLIWSATSRTADPGSVTDVQRDVVGLVLSGLVQENIISPKK